MAVYDLEEQESIEDLKAWWARWGTLVTWIAVAVAAVIVAVQGWRWWKASSAEAASALYAAVQSASPGEGAAKAKDAMATLADKYAGTGYAPRAALLRAKQLWADGDKAGARAQLTWVVDRADDDDLKQIARFRLAEVLVDEKQYDEALKVLDAKHADAYAGLYADLRGDALAAAGRRDEAPDDPAVDRILQRRGIEAGDRPAFVHLGVARRVPQLGGEVAVTLDAVLRHLDVATLGRQRGQGEAQGVGAVFVDQLQRVDDVALGLRHLLPVLVAHQGMDVDGAERHVAHEMDAQHHHAGDPEEDDIEAGDQHVAGIIAFQFRRLLRPAEG